MSHISFAEEDGYVAICHGLIPLTLHKVLTILLAFASVKKTLSSALLTFGSSFVSPKDLLVTSAMVPIPNPAAKPPNDTIRAIRDEGTFLCLAIELSCKDMTYIDSIFLQNQMLKQTFVK
jgi:hypothetical protein